METEIYRSSASSSSIEKCGSYSEDADDHILWNVGDLICNNRYIVRRMLGKGTFGTVLEVIDSKDRSIKALKVVRPGTCIKEAKKEEANLTRLNILDPNGEKGVVRLCNSFRLDHHYCLVVDKLGKSLFDLIKRNDYRGFNMWEIQNYTYQVLITLEFLHSHGIAHTDLKPENILFVRDSYQFDRNRRQYKSNVLDVRLIDYGGATFPEQYHTTTVNTRHYRAPEILLRNGWDHTSDIWCLGCILVELYTGNMLFPIFDDYSHLALIVKLLGHIPLKMVKACGALIRKYFTKQYRLNWPQLNNSHKLLRVVNRALFIEDLIGSEHQEFVHLVYSMLRLMPSRRITAAQALRHPFFQRDYSSYK